MCAGAVAGIGMLATEDWSYLFRWSLTVIQALSQVLLLKF